MKSFYILDLQISREKEFRNHYRKRSLNIESRRKKRTEIVSENKSFLRRLQDQKSQYDAERYNNERKRMEKILKNISEYPYIHKKTLGPLNSTNVSWMEDSNFPFLQSNNSKEKR